MSTRSLPWTSKLDPIVSVIPVVLEKHVQLGRTEEAEAA